MNDYREKNRKTALRRRCGIATLVFWTIFLQQLSLAQARLVFLDSAVVNDTVIRLGDIAAISGLPEGETLEKIRTAAVGEAAPAGYTRFVAAGDVVLYSGTILRNVLIDRSSKLKRIPVRTDFQVIRLETYEHDFYNFAASQIDWPKADYQLRILNNRESCKCLRMPFSTRFEDLSSRYPKGNIICRLIIRQGYKTMKIPVSCFISISTPVMVASSKIPRGAQLTQENCHQEKKEITHFKFVPYTTLQEIVSRTALRSLDPGSIIHEKNTASIPLVKRDDVVQLIVKTRNIKICIDARARQSGGMGSEILVENEMTHKLIKARIVQNGQVTISQGDGKI
jgi:flagella basal body P-ring formation protein FlgA